MGDGLFDFDEDEEIRVRAPVDEPGTRIRSEIMSAAPDPAASDQAVLLNAPFWIDGLNFGDLVRLGPKDDLGVRPIEAVVTPSGHSRVMAALGNHDGNELCEELRCRFPHYALRVEGWDARIICVSVHPDFDPDAVIDAIVDWLDDHDALDDEDVIVSPVIETEVGPIPWPERG
jgi:hypothetical protein